MIGFAVMALVGLQTLTIPWPYNVAWIGLWTFWVAMVLFVAEFLLSLYQ